VFHARHLDQRRHRKEHNYEGGEETEKEEVAVFFHASWALIKGRNSG